MITMVDTCASPTIVALITDTLMTERLGPRWATQCNIFSYLKPFMAHFSKDPLDILKDFIDCPKKVVSEGQLKALVAWQTVSKSHVQEKGGCFDFEIVGCDRISVL